MRVDRVKDVVIKKHEETSERIKTLVENFTTGNILQKIYNFMFKIICPVICLFNCTGEIYFCQTFQYMARHCLVSGRYFEPCLCIYIIDKLLMNSNLTNLQTFSYENNGQKNVFQLHNACH